MGWSRKNVGAVGAVLILGLGCASERGFRPYDGDDPDGDASVDDPADAGGWGDWELGEVPDLAIALIAWRPTDGQTELLLSDLRGQVIDRWSPPIDPTYGMASLPHQVHAAGPGRVLVTTHLGLWNTEFGDKQGPHQPAGGFRAMATIAEVWQGDLVTRTWTRAMHLDLDNGRLVVDATGQVLPIRIWEETWHVRVHPYGHDGDRLLVSWDIAQCRAGGAHERVLGVSLDGRATERFWALDRAWDLGVEPSVVQLHSGADADGAPSVLASVGPHLCEQSEGLDVADRLVHWPLDGVGRTLDSSYISGDDVAFHAPSASALIISPPNEDRGHWLRWTGTDSPFSVQLDHSGGVRPIAALDPEHGAAMLAVTGGDGADTFVLMAGGRSVWEIDELRDGLGKRRVSVFDAAVIEVPR